MPSPSKIPVVLYGQAGSGKRTLAAALHGRIHRRNNDKAVFSVDIRTDSDLATPFVGLVAVDITGVHNELEALIRRAASQATVCACVVTKIDTVPRDYSDQHINSIGLQRRLAYHYNVDCVGVSSTSGEGFEELLDWIVDTVPHSRLTSQSSLSDVWRHWLDWFLDSFAYCFSLPTRRMTHKVEEELAEIAGKSDLNELLSGDFVSTWNIDIMRRFGSPDPVNRSGVYRVTPSLILKFPPFSEYANTVYAFRHTTIPIPRVHRYAHFQMVMDYVRGDMLMECWSHLSWFLQFRIACTLRLYVRQLRTLKHTTVGAVDTGYTQGTLFEGRVFGPFVSVQQFRRLCEYAAFEAWRVGVLRARRNGTSVPSYPRSPVDWTLVFTHGDLNWSNIVIDDNQTVWLIDWAESGFYPPWMETLALRHFNDIPREGQPPTSWTRYREFITGAATKEEGYFWDCVYGAIGRFPGRERD